jgi:hypothetical protein
MFEYLKFSNIQGQKVRTVLASLMLRLSREGRISGEVSFQFPQTLLTVADQRQLMNAIVEVEWLHQREILHVVDKMIPFEMIARECPDWIEVFINHDFIRLCQRLAEDDLWILIGMVLELPHQALCVPEAVLIVKTTFETRWIELQA